MKYCKQITAIILSAILAASPLCVFAAENEEYNVSKDESVYLFLNPDGSVKKQTVSCWLHSDSGLKGVEDSSNLSDIKNVKGDLLPVQKDGKLMWETDENDVYYQGQSDSKTPVNIDISYKLDGKEISAEELIGKSGKVEISLNVKNNRFKEETINGIKKRIYAPLAVAVIADMPADTFKNVNAGSGNILTDSQNQLASFVLLPGLRENFDGIESFDSILSELDEILTDKITITADVENFSMPMIDFAAASSLDELKEINLNDKVTQLSDGMQSLQEASSELKEGTELLHKALGEFDDKMGEFQNSYQQFDSGLASAAAGAHKLNDGAKELQSALDKLKVQVNEQLVPGIKGSSAKQQELMTKMNELKKQLESINVPDMDTITKQIQGAFGQVCSTSSDITIKILTNGKTLSDLPQEQQAMILKAREQILQQANGQLSQMMSQLDLSMLYRLEESLKEIDSLSSELMGSMNQLVNALYQENDNPNDPKTLSGAILALSAGADKLAGEALDMENGTDELTGASNTINQAISSFKKATGELSDKSGTLDSGMAQFKEEGIDKLSSQNIISRLSDGRLAVVCNGNFSGKSKIYLWLGNEDGTIWEKMQDTGAEGIVPDKLLETAGGRWIISCHTGNKPGFSKLHQRLWYSDDKGKNWIGPVIVAKDKRYNLCEGSILEVKPNVLVCFMRENSSEGIECIAACSEDCGLTWGEVYSIPLACCHRPVSGFLDTGEIMITYRYRQGAQKGWLGLWTQNTFLAVTDCKTVLTDDRKEQWVRIMPLNYDPSPNSDLGYTGWVQFDDGMIYIVDYIVGTEEKAHIIGCSLYRSDIGGI